MQHKPKILLVDDKKANLLALNQLLENMGLDLFEAESGELALELTLKHDFALIISDVISLFG